MFKISNLFMWWKTEFPAEAEDYIFQSSVSHDHLEITLIIYFKLKKIFPNITVFIVFLIK